MTSITHALCGVIEKLLDVNTIDDDDNGGCDSDSDDDLSDDGCDNGEEVSCDSNCAMESIMAFDIALHRNDELDTVAKLTVCTTATLKDAHTHENSNEMSKVNVARSDGKASAHSNVIASADMVGDHHPLLCGDLV